MLSLAAEALFTTSKKSSKRKIDLTGMFDDKNDFTADVESSQEIDLVQDSPRCSKKEVNEPKEHAIGNKPAAKNSKRSKEKSNVSEHDGSREKSKKKVDSENGNVHEKDSGKPDKKEATTVEGYLEKTNSSCKSIEKGYDKDNIVTERKDEVDGDPPTGEIDKNHQLNSKSLKDTKVKIPIDMKAKSDTKDDDQDQFEYLDAKCNSPSDIFAISDEGNNLFDEVAQHNTDKEENSIVSLEDGRLTVSQESDSSLYYDDEDCPGIICDKRTRTKINNRKSNPFKSHTNSSNNASNTKDNSDRENKKQDSDKSGNKLASKTSGKCQGSHKNVKEHDANKIGKDQISDKSSKEHSAESDKKPDSTKVSKEHDSDKNSEVHGSNKSNLKQTDRKSKRKGSSKSGKQNTTDTSYKEQKSDKLDKQGTDKSGDDMCSNEGGIQQGTDKSGKELVSDNSNKQKGRSRQKVDTITEKIPSNMDNDSARENNTNSNAVITKEGSKVIENKVTKPQEIEICSNEVTSSDQFLETSNNSDHIELLNESENESDSFDEMLKNYIKEKNVTMNSVGKADRSSIIDEDYVSHTSIPKGKADKRSSTKRKRDNNEGEPLY